MSLIVLQRVPATRWEERVVADRWTRERAALWLRRWAIGLPLVAMPLLLGGVRPWFWSTVAGVFVLSLIAWLWVTPKGVATPVRVSASWLLLAPILVYPFLQAAPIPISWLSLLSPERALWIERAGTALGWTIPGASVSYEPLLSFMHGARWMFLGLYAWMLRKALHEEKDMGWLFTLFFVIAGIEASYGILQALIPSLGVFGQRTGNGAGSGTFFNRNHYAAFLGMLWPLLLARLLSLHREPGRGARGRPSDGTPDRPDRHRQLFLSFMVGLVILGLFLSQSRAGILSSLVALTVFVILGGGERRRMLPFVIGCWAVMLTYGSAIGFEEIIERFSSIEASAPGRFRIWQDAWSMLLDHPWTGVGLGAFPRAITVYQSHLPEALDIAHAHCDYLQWAAELGLPVAGALIAASWIVWWRSAWRVSRFPGESGRLQPVDSRYRERRLIRIGAASGAAAFFCHGWVDFGGQIPANQVLFVALLVLMHWGLNPAPSPSISTSPSRTPHTQGASQ